MRILAANMQQRGFYRTPDEIKTRIRNLKCLYHRIKRSMASGTGLGTIDPDWPHFKAMDAILSKQGHKSKETLYENFLEGPKCEDIKQEIDIDLNDDLESFEANDSIGSEFEERVTPPPLQPTPLVTVKSTEQLRASTSEANNKTLPTILPSFALPTQNFQTAQTTTTNGVRAGTMPSIPVPLLILNSLQPQQAQEKTKETHVNSHISDKSTSDLQYTLKELVMIQREWLDIERQRLDMEKQRLRFEKLVGTQFITLIPMVGTLLERLTSTGSEDSEDTPPTRRSKKRPNLDEMDIFKDCKILRSMLEQGIKHYMMQNEKEHTNEDSGIQNDEASNASTTE
ncbi:hypothetical protein Trydic_g14369 [Trypoxylus dichotomus]